MPLSQIETASLGSGLVAPTATALATATGSAPSYAARAWVNFNGTGTVAIRAAGNVSSVTDLGVGYYRVNFATPMPDANFEVSGAVGIQPTGSGWGDLVILDTVAAPSTTSVTVGTIGYTTWQDTAIVTVSILR